MKYFFILGNHPSLSIAEILAIFPKNKGEIYQNNVFLLQSEEKIEPQKLIKKLGGTIKIGAVIKETTNKNVFLDSSDLAMKEAEKITGKFHFGFSNYAQISLDLKKLGMTIKNSLKQEGKNCRWVTSKEKILSSVIVEQNYLLDKGLEIIFIKNQEGELFIGHTLAVQPFKELSFRDYGRPTRDDHSGMIPPKLAQIMLNLANANKKEPIIDPFCGSGTILNEAFLMGFKNIFGSDISPKAVNDSIENLNWIKRKFPTNKAKTEIKLISATKIDTLFKKNSISAIITEPYLGPQRGNNNIKKTISELERLYGEALESFSKIIKSNGKVVMIWPIFSISENNNKKFLYINPPYSKWKIVSEGDSNRKTWIYGREGQKVWREIVILKIKTD